jgi:hypothetical protein
LMTGFVLATLWIIFHVRCAPRPRR